MVTFMMDDLGDMLPQARAAGERPQHGGLVSQRDDRAGAALLDDVGGTAAAGHHKHTVAARSVGDREIADDDLARIDKPERDQVGSYRRLMEHLVPGSGASISDRGTRINPRAR